MSTTRGESAPISKKPLTSCVMAWEGIVHVPCTKAGLQACYVAPMRCSRPVGSGRLTFAIDLATSILLLLLPQQMSVLLEIQTLL